MGQYFLWLDVRLSWRQLRILHLAEQHHLEVFFQERQYVGLMVWSEASHLTILDVSPTCIGGVKAYLLASFEQGMS